jgi:hypothetical protein
MVAQRDAVDPRFDQIAVDGRCQPRAGGGVLGIGDHQVQPLAGDQPGQGALHDHPPGAADDIADEKNAH